ncbi:MAG: T9SS type A sorting domain-containing protein [Bacteroidota bacterium]
MNYLRQFFLFGLILIIGYGHVCAQDGYSKVFFKPYKSVLSSSIVSTYDNSYIISGSRNDQNLLIKIDSEANIIWNKSFGTTNSYLSNDVISLLDSTFLFVCDAYSEALGYRLLQCVNFNIDGDTNWTSSIDMGNWVNVFSVQQTMDMGFVVAANVFDSDNPRRISIVKLDSVGIIQWSKSYVSGTLNNYAYSVKQTADSGYIVVGTISNQNPYERMAFVLKLDNSGEYVWAYNYQSALYDNSDGYDVLVEDDGFLISIEVLGYLNLIKINLQGVVVWANYYSMGSMGGFFGTAKRRIIKTDSNTYVVLSPDNVIGVDEMGNVLWHTNFYMYVVDFAKSSDNGFLVIGNGPIIGVKSFLTDDPQIGLVKIDSVGQTSGICSEQYYISYDTADILSETLFFASETIGSSSNASVEFVSETIQTEDACVAFISSVADYSLVNNFQISPNPSSGIFQLKSEKGFITGKIQVLDINGRKLLNRDINGNSWLINLEGNTKGLYFLQIVTETSSEIHKLILF